MLSSAVRSSPSKVGQFNFESFPLAQEISSVIHYLPCFGGGLSLCLFTEGSVLGGLFLCLTPFSGADSVLHPPLMLSVLDYSSLFGFQFYRTVQFWILLSGSGDHLCDPLPFLCWRVAYCPPALSLHCLSCVYLLIVLC
jgi:hypothetical protein